jgi:hypothetical protein
MRWLSLVLLVGMASVAQHCRKIDIDESSGSCTHPALTSGDMDPSLACVSNADRARSVMNSEKNAVPTAIQPTGTSPRENLVACFRAGWENLPTLLQLAKWCKTNSPLYWDGMDAACRISELLFGYVVHKDNLSV